MRVLVPHADAAKLMGGVPDRVQLIFWSGTEDLSPNSRLAEVFIPPWWAKSRAVSELARMPNLTLVQTLGAGYDWIISSVPEGVRLANNPGVNAGAVAEWALTAILSMRRDFPEFHDDQRSRRWQQRPTGELCGSKVLVIGHGAIGKRIAVLLKAFEADVAVVASRKRPGVNGPEEIVNLLGWADVVVVMVPLNNTTWHMVNAQFLATMRDGALLVNGARGAIVDTEALVAELKTGRIRASLDVTDPEPLPANHELWTLPGVLITPHVASVVPSFLPNSYRRIRAQLVRLAADEALENVVTQ